MDLSSGPPGLQAFLVSRPDVPSSDILLKSRSRSRARGADVDVDLADFALVYEQTNVRGQQP